MFFVYVCVRDYFNTGVKSSRAGWLWQYLGISVYIHVPIYIYRCLYMCVGVGAC